MSDDIEIKIEGQKLTPEKFLSGVREFLSLVQGVTKNVTNEHVDWAIEVDRGSNIVRMKATNPSAHSKMSIRTVCAGIRALRNGVRALPHGFTRANVSSAKILAELPDGSDVQAVSIKNGGDLENIPQSVIKTADDILTGQSHDDFGSVEGRIISLSARHGFICVMYDPVEQREITCYLQSDAAQRDAVKGYTKRVMASGLVHYASEGFPLSITVDEIRIFPPDSELPSVQDIQAIYEQYK